MSFSSFALLSLLVGPRPCALVGALVNSHPEAGEDGRGEHVPEDLPIVRPRLPLRSFPLWPPARLEQRILAVLLAPRVQVVWIVHGPVLSSLVPLLSLSLCWAATRLAYGYHRRARALMDH